ncbi:hypothetical protein PHYSODRAFT_446841, partial [Phytophthora sojae]
FRDHFRINRKVYHTLFDACAPFIARKIKYRREVIAVMQDWFGQAATCRDLE